MHKLSIIIPAYNAEPYIECLINKLKSQISASVEVIVVDDGSRFPFLPPYDWVNVIRQENKGLAGARNTGLETATGDIISFVDSDDVVADDFVQKILARADEEWDYMDLSWKSLEDNRFTYLLRSDADCLTNPSVCTKVWRRSFIGDLRFNDNKDVAEDEDFTRRIDLSRGKRVCITSYMYFYRTQTPNSLSKQYREGKTKTKRIVYYLPEIKADDMALLEEVKAESTKNEVVVMAVRCSLPDLSKYAQVMRPIGTWANELRGQKTNLVRIVEVPKSMETQVVIYMSKPHAIGGRETFIKNFCMQMYKHYDIVVVFDQMCIALQAELLPYVKVIKNDRNEVINCDTIIVNSAYDVIPSNINAKQSIQMVHGCKTSTARSLPTDKDITVCVSNAVKDSFGEEAKGAIVIRNMTAPGAKVKKCGHGEKLSLITASRLNVDPKWEDKGVERMRQLAAMLEKAGIEFTWKIFSETLFVGKGFESCGAKPNDVIKKEIAKADYLVQLSTAEAFCYSVVEALEIGTPVLVHPLPVFEELKVQDGKNAYIIPEDMNFNVKKLTKIPAFNYSYNNGVLVAKWKKLLGGTKPKGDYVPEKLLPVRILTKYRDMTLSRVLEVNETVLMPEERARAVAAQIYNGVPLGEIIKEE